MKSEECRMGCAEGKLSRRSALALPLAKRQCSRCCVPAAPFSFLARGTARTHVPTKFALCASFPHERYGEGAVPPTAPLFRLPRSKKRIRGWKTSSVSYDMSQCYFPFRSVRGRVGNRTVTFSAKNIKKH